MNSRAIVVVVMLAALVAGVGLVMWADGPGDAAASGRGVGRGASSDAEAPDRASSRAPAGGDGVGGAPREAEPGLPPPVDLEACDRDLDLHGVVIDPEGRPVAGARVRAIAHPGRRVSTLDIERYRRDVEGPETRSAVDGTFALRLDRGSSVELRVEADGFAVESTPRLGADARVTVRMTPAATLEVVCLDEAGRPVPDVAVATWRRAHETSYDRRDGVTDAAGRCAFEGMREGTVRIEILPEILGNPGWGEAALVAGEVTRHEVKLAAGRTIEGTVTDATTGEPIAGARVGEGWVLSRAVTTGVDGRYARSGYLPTGVHDLHATADGYGRQGKPIPASGPLDFALDPGDRVRGRLVDRAGAPVAGAPVAAVASERRDGLRIDTVSGESGDDGRFLLSGLRRELPHTLVVEAAGLGRMLLDFDPHPGAPGLIDLGDLVLPPARRLEGHAVGPDGGPRADAVVLLAGENDDRGRLRPDRPTLDFLYGRTERTRTDDLGRFRFADLAPGTYELTLQEDGAPPVSSTVVLTPDEDRLDVVLRQPVGLRLIVELVDERGSPISGLQVLLDGAAPRRRLDGTTGEDGTATFEDLPARDVHVRVWGDRRYLAVRPVRTSTTAGRVRITMHERSRIAGEVIDSNGDPLEGLLVHARGVGFEAEGTTEADGRFEIEVPPGKELDLAVDGGRATRHDVRPGVTRRSIVATPYRARLAGVVAPREGIVLVAREVAFDGVIRVRVLAPDGRPAARAELFARGVGDDHRATADEDGRATFADLPPGEYSVHAAPPAGASADHFASSPVPARTGRPEVTLHLRPLALLRGRVLDADGRPVANASLRTLDDDGEILSLGRTTADGRFELRAPAGAPVHVEGHITVGGRPIAIPRTTATPGGGEVELRVRGG